MTVSKLQWSLLCLLALFRFGQCEIRSINLFLEPVSSYIHYFEGFILTPGTIDLSGLHFKTVKQTYVPAEFNDNDKKKNGGGDRRLDSDVADVVDNSSFEGNFLDVVVFHLPSKCANTQIGCNWTELGVGARTADGSPHYCCNNDAIDEKLCSKDMYGRLMIDSEKFKGQHREVPIPLLGDADETLKYPSFEQKDDDEADGMYVLVLANCNDEGRPVQVKGQAVWKSRHGYLPGDLFGLMYFYAFVTILYFGILLWYGLTMKNFEESTIPIQKWIFGTICMGSLELFFRTGDLFVWNEDGSRFWVAYFVGVIVGVLKRGVSRCLMVMVSLGWGVVRDDLGGVMKKIICLGGVYVVVSALQDVMSDVAKLQEQKMKEEEEEELFNIVRVLVIVVAFIDVLFYLWIIDSLNWTMEYLESLSQASKLQRYLRLRCVLLFSILFAVIWCVLAIVDGYDEGVVDQESKWVVDASMELNYIFVLLGVAVLWRPNSNAKEYAFVMELPASNGSEGDDELEMTGVVPSAADDEEEDDVRNDA